MAAVIFAGTFGGIKLDKLTNLSFPIFTVSLSIVSVIIAMYLVLKDLLGRH